MRAKKRVMHITPEKASERMKKAWRTRRRNAKKLASFAKGTAYTAVSKHFSETRKEAAIRRITRLVQQEIEKL